MTTILICGCGGGSGSGGSSQSVNPIATELDGTTWKAASVSDGKGNSGVCPGNIQLTGLIYLVCTSSETLVFKKIGSSSLQITDSSNESSTVTTTVQLSGNTFEVHVPASSDSAAYTTMYSLSISGTSMTWTQVSSTSADPTLGSDYNGTSTTYQEQ